MSEPVIQRIACFDVSTEEGEFGFARMFRVQAGGNPARFGDRLLALTCAMRALHGAMEMLGFVKMGPAPVVITMPHDLYLQFRDQLCSEGEAGKQMFLRHRRKRIDPFDLVTMLGGITIASDQAPPDQITFRCPLMAPKAVQAKRCAHPGCTQTDGKPCAYPACPNRGAGK